MLDSFLLSLGNPALVKFVSFRPTGSEIRVTENCNSRCITCNAWKNRSVDELTTEEFRDVFYQLKRLGVSCVTFSGGEPLLRRDVGSLIKEARSTGFNEVMLITNGLLLEQRAPELIESGLTHLLVSIDGIEATDNKIKGIPTHFERATKGIRVVNRLKEKEKVDFKTVVLTTPMKLNIKEIPLLIERCHDLGALWYFNLLECNIDFFRDIDILDLLVSDHKSIDILFDYLGQMQKERPSATYFCNHQLEYARGFLKGKDNYVPCVHGYRRINIGAHGEVYSGCFVLGPIGNVREEKISEIVKTKRYRKRLERMYVRRCTGCTNLWGEQILSKSFIAHSFRCEGKGRVLFRKALRKVGRVFPRLQ